MGPIVMLLALGLLGSLVGGAALAVIEGVTAYGDWRDRRAADREALARLAGGSHLDDVELRIPDVVGPDHDRPLAHGPARDETVLDVRARPRE